MPPFDPQEASGMITGSEKVLKEYTKKASLTAKDIKALIQDVLHNPDFNAEEVYTDTLQRFANSIDSGDVHVISMHLEGDGAQKLELFKRPAEKVLRELISDIRLDGCQHFGFREYLDPHGNRLFEVDRTDKAYPYSRRWTEQIKFTLMVSLKKLRPW